MMGWLDLMNPLKLIYFLQLHLVATGFLYPILLDPPTTWEARLEVGAVA